MPRKTRSTNKPSTLTPTPDYWTSFLETQNLIGHITRQIEEAPTTTIPTKNIPTEPIIITPDQWTFIFRVAEALIPVAGYSPEIKKKLLKTREMYRLGLEKVFREQTDFEAWFTDTRQKMGIREVELMEIVYDALEGLHSLEAKELRETFGKTVERMRMVRAGIV